MQTFPAVSDLARANDELLLKQWEGLGYYSRARNLKKAAQAVMDKHGGVFPNTYEGILSLPGIGPYTAGAIASIAFGLPCPAVDGNVLRVIARLCALKESIDAPAVRKEAEKALQGLYPKGECGDFTQALMELGATICLPNGAPLCEACPLSGLCIARRNEAAETYPRRTPKKARKTEELTIFVLTCQGKTAIQKRGEKGLLSSLWELPNKKGRLAEEEAQSWLEQRGIRAARVEQAGERKHVFTHVEWRMHCLRAVCDNEGACFTWATEDELATVYALPSAFKICLK
jgi:A/G-specific adenine glycosylase